MSRSWGDFFDDSSDVAFEFVSTRAAPECHEYNRISRVNALMLFVLIVTIKATLVIQFKADRLQMIVVAKNLSVLQLFISRMPKMGAILQLVSAPLNPIPIAEHFRRSHPQCEHSYGQHIYMSKENNAK